MPYREGPRRARFAETDNYQQGRSGSKVPIRMGPPTRTRMEHNPQNGGGINRATKGTGVGKKNG